MSKVRSFNQEACFGHLSEGVEFKFQGNIWTRDDQEGAYRRDGSGAGFKIDYIRSMEPVFISLD